MHKFWSSLFKYDPQKYWLERGKKFYDEKLYDKNKYREQEKKLLNYLSSLDFSSVLEFGCGFGRITELLLKNFEINEYLALDISPDLIKHAKNLEKKFGNIRFDVCDIRHLELEKKYDLVIGSEVLMHVPPNDIENVIENLIEHTKKHLVNIDWYQDSKPIFHAGHNFVHRYEEIYRKNKLIFKINKISIEGMQPPSAIFHCEIVSK